MGLDRRAFLGWLGRGAFGVSVVGAASRALPAVAEPGTAAPSTTGVTVLRRATVIDATGAPPQPEQTIVLIGDRIAALGRHAEVPAVAGVRVVDLAERYVIPGLWDMHTHFGELEPIVPPLHLVNGVTAVREMRGTPEVHATRDRIDRGELTGPRMLIGSEIVDGPHPVRPDSSVSVRTAAEARAFVRQARRDGAEFIKVYSMLSHETFAAIADEARRQRLPFVGHVPGRIPVDDAVRLGMHSAEHLYGMFLSTSTEKDTLYARLAAMPDDPQDPDYWGRHMRRMDQDAVATHSPARAAALYRLMIRRESWQTPTLAVERIFHRPPQDTLTDPALAELARTYIPNFVLDFWRGPLIAQPPWTPEQTAQSRAYFAARMGLVRAMGDAGVGLIAGTDAGASYMFPGFTMHAELELLVRSGLSPMHALQAATRNAARAAGQERASGTVSVGKRADLVVLDGDPLADIRHTARIHAVIARGRYLAPADRQRILGEVAAAAAGLNEEPPEDWSG